MMRKLDSNGFEIIFGFWALFILVLVVLGIFVAIAVFWGLVGLLGLFIVLGSIWYASKTGWNANSITIGLLVLGMVLMLISIFDIGGLEIMKFANPFGGLF